jgi:hypothetical protein
MASNFGRILGILAVLVTLLVTASFADTSLSGGYSGVFKWNPDSKTVSVSALTLGACYRPDATPTVAALKAGKIEPQNFEFFTEQAFVDGAPDVNLTGLGYAFWWWPSLSIIGEVAVATSSVGDNAWTIGPMAGVKMPFTAQGKSLEFKYGIGYFPATATDNSQWFMRLGLGFVAP